MHGCLFLHALRLYQLDQSSKGALGVHHVKDIIVFAIAPIV
jgi:hypothetical protein